MAGLTWADRIGDASGRGPTSERSLSILPGSTGLLGTMPDMADATVWCFNGVQAMAALHAQTGGGDHVDNAKASIFDGSTETVVYNSNPYSTSLLYGAAMVTPASTPWSKAAVNALVARIGYSTDAAPPPYWDAVNLEADVQL